MGQKWALLEKKYLPCDWTSGIKVWIADAQGCDLSARKSIKKTFLTKLQPAKKRFVFIPFFLHSAR